ncbi:MAG TPA: hypothetical protein VK601_10885 [Kofleriaceae bacterium]|nr:hypothetical protein [Kofleriaceae bacterium]
MTEPRFLLALALVPALVPRLAAGEPHKVLVLQSEGRVDPGLRTRINAALARLATAADLQATPGELTFSDAAMAVGCRPDAPACKDEVLGMLAVDEIVITTVTPKPGGVEIAVQRVGRGGAERDATMLLATGAAPDRLDGIAPLFNDRAPSGTPPGAAPPSPAIAASQPPGEAPVIPPPASVVLPPAAVPETAPASAGSADRSLGHDQRLQIAGMAGGAGLATIGVLLWAAASGAQNDIDQAQTTSRQDLANLRDLESRADTYAALGNVLVASGVIVGGIATYLYVRDRRAASTASARVMPTVLDHGAGLVLTIGGTP